MYWRMYALMTLSTPMDVKYTIAMVAPNPRKNCEMSSRYMPKTPIMSKMASAK